MDLPRDRGRTAALVVLEDGEPVGISTPISLSTPWWNDVAELSSRHPGLAVLRLLDGEVVRGGELEGAARYLVEWLPDASAEERAVLGDLAPVEVTLPDDELRMPWARPGGPGEDLAWAAGIVPLVGRPRQQRTWNLSAIWELPTQRGRVWLKCVPAFMRHEVAVLGLLAGQRVPRLLGAEGHRELLEELPGHDGYDATYEQHCELIDLLVELQEGTLGRDDELLAMGVTDRRFPALLEAASKVVDRHAAGDDSLRRLLEESDERVRRIESFGLPNALVHGDAHPGNARIGEGAGRGFWYDWGDSRVAHPMVDLAVLDRPVFRRADELRAHWIAAWRQVVPGSDPAAAWALAKPLAALSDAVVYQGFLDRIEATERPYHVDDVPNCLERAARLAEESPL